MNHRGFSLVEALIYGSLATWIGLGVVRYMKVPLQLNSMMQTVNTEEAGYSATTLPVDDLKCSIGASIQWNSIDASQPNPPYDPAVNSQFIPWFQVNDPSITPLPLSYVCYRYRSSDGAFIREFISGAPPSHSSLSECAPTADDHSQTKVIVKGMLPPTADKPLFIKDPAANNMVILMLQFPGSKNKPMTIVRRVHIRS
jgi:hypothetical protein